jgi:ABC transport system ATP-binding/permease protein
MFKLVIQDDEGKTTVVPLIRDEITIGRKEGNTIRLTERNVSRRHARIARSNGTVEIEDLDSYNGVIVNGTRVEGRVKLAESDRVQIGDYLIELKSEVAAAALGAATGGISPTQPIERVDPLEDTPVPDRMPEASSDAATRPVSASAQTAEQPAQSVPVGFPPAPQPAPAPVAASEPPPTPAVAPQERARLVVLSSNFAGHEYELDKPAIVIGRTDDNDIIINHRSISRHHAKVVQENGRHAIVDLQSSNGVRVNGEEYGKVELRRGDVIDLGHVRLRFVEPGEDFLLGRDAQIVDLAAEASRSRRGFLGAVIVLIAIAIGVVALATRGGGRAAEPERPVAPQTTNSPAAPESNPPAGVIPTLAPQPPPVVSGPAAALLEQAGIARSNEDWSAMAAAAAKALEADPASAEARAFQDEAAREVRNKTVYDKFVGAVAIDDWNTIAQQYRLIADNSLYKAKAQSQHDRKRDEFVGIISREADALAGAGKCKAIVRMSRRAGQAWPEAKARADQALDSCKQPRVAAVTPPPVEPPPPPLDVTPPPRRPPPPPPPPPKRSAGELADEASEAAKKGNYGRAHKLCEEALEAQAGHPKALMVCTIASCKLRNTSRARRHFRRLMPVAQRQVKQLCAQSGVKVD